MRLGFPNIGLRCRYHATFPTSGFSSWASGRPPPRLERPVKERPPIEIPQFSLACRRAIYRRLEILGNGSPRGHHRKVNMTLCSCKKASNRSPFM
ncbi:hypothetical protein BC830DRAFT_1116163 [Chytriomyces sp. MP71]|nr:hypothetical protein BC830DRAFT_1116163 [Chytriomyces sp. MP71]